MSMALWIAVVDTFLSVESMEIGSEADRGWLVTRLFAIGSSAVLCLVARTVLFGI